MSLKNRLGRTHIVHQAHPLFQHGIEQRHARILCLVHIWGRRSVQGHGGGVGCAAALMNKTSGFNARAKNSMVRPGNSFCGGTSFTPSTQSASSKSSRSSAPAAAYSVSKYTRCEEGCTITRNPDAASSATWVGDKGARISRGLSSRRIPIVGMVVR